MQRKSIQAVLKVLDAQIKALDQDIASGGITNLDDIKALCAVEAEGIMGAITGRAIYEGKLDFAAAQKLADELGE